MIKCLFFGHNWQHERTYTGTRTCSIFLGRCQTDHDLTLEYYKCSRCGLWKRKTFVDHELDETKYFAERPIEKDEQ